MACSQGTEVADLEVDICEKDDSDNEGACEYWAMS